MLTLYKNGFVVNDGPLRSYDDDEGRAFLKDLEQGYVPRELASHGRNIDVVFNPKRDEEYKQALQHFLGLECRLVPLLLALHRMLFQ